jgi:hypothetical protein
MMKEKDRNMREKLYTKPTLVVYGKVSELTATVGNTGGTDGVTGKFHKTSV